MVLLYHTIYISVDFAHHMIFRYKVGKGGIISIILHAPIIKMHAIDIVDWSPVLKHYINEILEEYKNNDKSQ